jgi:ubiquitin C-terminal hydrolase
MIRLKRFANNGLRMVKNNKLVDIPLIVTIPNLYGNCRYKLHSVIFHFGRDISGGHYTSLIDKSMNPNTVDFHYFNDEIHIHFNGTSYSNLAYLWGGTNPYLVTYRKIEPSEGEPLVGVRLPSVFYPISQFLLFIYFRANFWHLVNGLINK